MVEWRMFHIPKKIVNTADKLTDKCRSQHQYKANTPERNTYEPQTRLPEVRFYRSLLNLNSIPSLLPYVFMQLLLLVKLRPSLLVVSSQEMSLVGPESPSEQARRVFQSFDPEGM